MGKGDVGDCRQAESSSLGCDYFRSPNVGGRMKSDTCRHSTLQVTDSHNTHSRLDMRISRYATLVNKESSCWLSSAEMVASGSGWGIGWMGERQDWPVTAPFLDRRSRLGRLRHKLLAIA